MGGNSPRHGFCHAFRRMILLTWKMNRCQIRSLVESIGRNEGWPCIRESFTPFNHQSRNFPHSRFQLSTLRTGTSTQISTRWKRSLPPSTMPCVSCMKAQFCALARQKNSSKEHHWHVLGGGGIIPRFEYTLVYAHIWGNNPRLRRRQKKWRNLWGKGFLSCTPNSTVLFQASLQYWNRKWIPVKLSARHCVNFGCSPPPIIEEKPCTMNYWNYWNTWAGFKRRGSMQ